MNGSAAESRLFLLCLRLGLAVHIGPGRTVCDTVLKHSVSSLTAAVPLPDVVVFRLVR